jgi:hypothetical protein
LYSLGAIKQLLSADEWNRDFRHQFLLRVLNPLIVLSLYVGNLDPEQMIVRDYQETMLLRKVDSSVFVCHPAALTPALAQRMRQVGIRIWIGGEMGL